MISNVSKLFWKCFLLLEIFMFFYLVWLNRSSWNVLILVSRANWVIMLLGLFGLAWGKRIFSSQFWKIYFPLNAVFYLLQMVIAVPVLIYQRSLSGFLILACDLVLYGANFCYAYLNPSLDSVSPSQ